jgi:hypothetical protein
VQDERRVPLLGEAMLALQLGKPRPRERVHLQRPLDTHAIGRADRLRRFRIDAREPLVQPRHADRGLVAAERGAELLRPAWRREEPAQ